MNYFLNSERYWGHIEYKRNLVNMTADKIKKYATQLQFRIIEGSGKAIYIIGVEDDGKIIGVNHDDTDNCKNKMVLICNEIDAKIKSYQKINLDKNLNLLIYNLSTNKDLGDLPYLFG
tara:strand:- start:117 stop:470 length:354 start_codon:yes stop_codon:yes gene_type:complete